MAGVFRSLGIPVTDHVYEDGEILCNVADLGLLPPLTLVNARLLLRKAEYVHGCQCGSTFNLQ